MLETGGNALSFLVGLSYGLGPVEGKDYKLPHSAAKKYLENLGKQNSCIVDYEKGEVTNTNEQDKKDGEKRAEILKNILYMM